MKSKISRRRPSAIPHLTLTNPTRARQQTADTLIDKATIYPSKAELLSALPAELTQFNPVKAWGSLVMSVGLSIAAVGIGTTIPLTLSTLPL